MKVKSHSIMIGYQEYEAKMGRAADGRPLLMVDSIGPLTALDYIKHGFMVLDCTPQEKALLKQGEYPVR